MSEAKFTKGEWYVPNCDDCTVLQVVAKDAKKHLFSFCDEPFDHDDEDFANANLIAAAPEMYEILKHQLHNMSVGSWEYERTVKILAKARGENES